MVEILREVEAIFASTIEQNDSEPVRCAVVTENKTSERKVIKQMCNTAQNTFSRLAHGLWALTFPCSTLIVILRRIGSRTPLEQLVGRGTRWLETGEKNPKW